MVAKSFCNLQKDFRWKIWNYVFLYISFWIIGQSQIVTWSEVFLVPVASQEYLWLFSIFKKKAEDLSWIVDLIGKWIFLYGRKAQNINNQYSYYLNCTSCLPSGCYLLIFLTTTCRLPEDTLPLLLKNDRNLRLVIFLVILACISARELQI